MAACTAASPQLQPTDFGRLERLETREDRERAYVENSINVTHDARGVRYRKGTDTAATARGWQSLDAILRSDATSAALLPARRQRAVRVLTALAAVAGIATAAGFVASAREGLDLSRLTGGGALLLGSGAATIGLGIAAGVVYGRMKSDYVRAIDAYNDSLGLRLGLYTAGGEYIPPRNVHVDAEGFVVLDSPEVPEAPVPAPRPAPAPAPLPDVAPPAATEPAPDAPTETAPPDPEVPAEAPPPVQTPRGTRPGALSLSPRRSVASRL